MTLDEATASLDRYAGYGEGWDGFRAAAVSGEAIAALRAILTHPSTTAPDWLIPLEDGSVRAEWLSGGSFVTLAAGPGGELEWNVGGTEEGAGPGVRVVMPAEIALKLR